jgi:hypothetical protein
VASIEFRPFPDVPKEAFEFMTYLQNRAEVECGVDPAILSRTGAGASRSCAGTDTLDKLLDRRQRSYIAKMARLFGFRG